MKTSLFITIILLIGVFGCSKTTEPKPDPIVLQLDITNISKYGGSDGAINLTVTGGTKPYQYQWSNGETTEDITNLVVGTYSVTVTDANVETISDSTTITQPNDTTTVIDIDGNVYHTVTIGSQIWLVENLRTTRLNDGEQIPNITDNVEWYNLTTPGYCWYDNDLSNKETYGALYNWYAVNTGRLAPSGWHIPTQAEWIILISHLGGENIAGSKLKESGTIHWLSPNTGATNESGFTALGAGVRDNSFFLMMEANYIWSSSSETGNSTQAYQVHLHWNNGRSSLYTMQKYSGFTVRCIRD